MRVTGFVRRALVALGATAALAVLALWLTLPPDPRATGPSASAATASAAATIVRGAYHVHTTRSDGSGSVEEVAAAAARAGLAFVIFTDHGDGRRAPDAPAYHAGVLCIDAVEISTTGGHYVAIGLPQAPYRLAGESRDVVEDVARLGGFGVAAHPDSPKRELAWSDWRLPIDGLEWLNLDTEWRDESRARILLGLVQHLVRPVATVGALINHPSGVLERWDRMTPTRRVTALAASDAHARFGVENAFDSSDAAVLEVPSYETSFRTVQIGVVLRERLTGNASADAAAVERGVREGRVVSWLAALADPGSISFAATSDGRSAGVGEFLSPGDTLDVAASADTPADGRLRLVCDGAVVREAPTGQRLTHSWRGGAPAACRLEAGWDAGARFARWLVTNPIYFRVADPPKPVPAPVTLRDEQSLGDPARGATWVVEHDRGSRVEVTQGGAGRAQQIAVAYTLAAGERAGQYAAIVTPDVEALATRALVAFRARADRPMRVSVQVRDPEGGGDGRRWRRSVYVDTTPHDIAIAFDDMRPVPPNTNPHPAPAALRSLLFVVDTEHTPTGQSGTVWIDDLRVARRP
jgi:hypothetical protein